MDYVTDICSIIAYIEVNVKSNADYSKLEKTVGFSYHHLRDFFQKAMGISLSRYILSRKIANVAFEIRHSDKKITEIAFEYGFSNLDTFTRAFRRNTGLTPSEFRKSNYLCGRRIIYPGVYAPIILDIDSPKFTLPKLKEVNEMGEMKKTMDSCILYGVPKIHWGKEVEGQVQCTPFPMCLQVILNYMGQNISYAQIMASSGAAFRQRWGIEDGGWDFAAVDIRNTFFEHRKAFELAFSCAGRSFKIIEEGSKQDYLELIKQEVSCGRPVIALGVVGPPEACIITGYKDNGEVLLGWSLFQVEGDTFGGAASDESGYFIQGNWWENIEGVMSVGEDILEYAPAKEILQNALTIMTQEKTEVYEGKIGCSYLCGQAAFEAWAKAIEDDSVFAKGMDINDRGFCQNDAEVMLGEGRGFAASFISSLIGNYPSIAKELKQCAEILKLESECMTKMREARGGYFVCEETMEKFRDKGARTEVAKFIRQAAHYEKEACVVLKEIIDKIGGQEYGKARNPKAYFE